MPSSFCDRFSKRLLMYLTVWVIGSLAFQAFLRPDGLTETDLSEAQQRLRWPLYTPIMVVFGLAQSATWPAFPGSMAMAVAVIVLLLLAVVVLACARPRAFAALLGVHSLTLAVAVVYFVRYSRLPSGP